MKKGKRTFIVILSLFKLISPTELSTIKDVLFSSSSQHTYFFLTKKDKKIVKATENREGGGILYVCSLNELLTIFTRDQTLDRPNLHRIRHNAILAYKGQLR